MSPVAPVVLPASHVRRVVAVEPQEDHQPGYSARWFAFYLAHELEFVSAWLNPGQSARAILERLDVEYRNLRHSRPACMCWCEGKRHQRCEDWRLSVGGYGRESNLLDDVGREIGRTSPVHPPMPPAEILDLARLSAKRLRSTGAMVAFLNGRAA